MARVQPSPFDIGAGGAPLGLWKSRGGSVAALAALIVRLPLRKQVGFRNLSWSNIGVVFLGMMAWQWFDNVHFSMFTLFGGGVVYGDNTEIRNFALAWLALAVFEHFKRLGEEKRGGEPHNFSPGISRLGLTEFLPLSPKVIAIAVEPALAFLAGAVMRRLGYSMLGWVLIAASLCFCISEWRLSRQTKEHRRDMHDIDLEARWEADLANKNARRHETAQGSEPIRAGIDGLESEIENRKATEGGAL